LYKNDQGYYFSMISPEEWNTKSEYINSYVYESNGSLTPSKEKNENLSDLDEEFGFIKYLK
jgi:hypothetical protein